MIHWKDICNKYIFKIDSTLEMIPVGKFRFTADLNLTLQLQHIVVAVFNAIVAS